MVLIYLNTRSLYTERRKPGTSSALGSNLRNLRIIFHHLGDIALSLIPLLIRDVHWKLSSPFCFTFVSVIFRQN